MAGKKITWQGKEVEVLFGSYGAPSVYVETGPRCYSILAGWESKLAREILATPEAQAALAVLKAEAEAETARRQAEIETQRREAETRLANARADGELVYIRYGKAPRSGLSHNGRDGGHELGLSVYPGYRLPGGEIVLDLTGIDDTPWWEMHLARPAYLVSGTTGPVRVVGRGGDGEPVVAEAQVSSAAYNKRLISWVKLG